jgi:hypothetical protein
MQHNSYVLETFVGVLREEARNRALSGGVRAGWREIDEWFDEFKLNKLRHANDGMQMLHGVLMFMFLTNRVLPRAVPHAVPLTPLREMSGDAVHKYMAYLDDALEEFGIDVAAQRIVETSAVHKNPQVQKRVSERLSGGKELVGRLKQLSKPLVRCLDFQEVSASCMHSLGARAAQEAVLYLTVSETQGAAVAIADASATRLPRWV